MKVSCMYLRNLKFFTESDSTLILNKQKKKQGMMEQIRWEYSIYLL